MSISYPDLYLTKFPEEVDTFVQMLDIVASDALSLKAYQEAMQSGNVAKANEALASMANGAQKILTADKLNQMFDSIEALQRFLATDIIPYVEQLQNTWINEVNKFTYRGDYDPTEIYSKNNIVSYDVYDGLYKALYLCIITTTAGIAPTNEVYWKKLTIEGPRGTSPYGSATIRDAWENNIDYVEGDAVFHGNTLWWCLQDNKNSEPSDDNHNWYPLLRLYGRPYPIQPNEPSGQEAGDIWFQQIGADF